MWSMWSTISLHDVPCEIAIYLTHHVSDGLLPGFRVHSSLAGYSSLHHCSKVEPGAPGSAIMAIISCSGLILVPFIVNKIMTIGKYYGKVCQQRLISCCIQIV